jgi:hypothetical protein
MPNGCATASGLGREGMGCAMADMIEIRLMRWQAHWPGSSITKFVNNPGIASFPAGWGSTLTNNPR